MSVLAPTNYHERPASGCLGNEAQVTCHYYWIFNAARTVPGPGTVLSGHVVLSLHNFWIWKFPCRVALLPYEGTI